ncbi:MAG: DUF4179 domain-containing protein [Lachnospiraceae bacterium]|nr:DUF4179 domain-containing protein [Lachnospiraceae bacterium]
MKREDLYHGISGICPEYLDEVDAYKPRKTTHWKRWATAAACISLCFCGAVPALAAADNGVIYEWLYAVSPSMAQKLKPVNVSCEDQGIQMEVAAADIEGANAKILVSMQDMIGERLDETTDLFDSYSIHTPYDQIGGCSLVEYDAAAKTAFFMLTIEQMDQALIPGDKITFSVNEILTGKKHSDRELTEIDLGNVPLISDLMEAPDIRGGSGRDLDVFGESGPRLMRPKEASASVLEEGVTLTGYGIVDGKLHVQIRYDRILETDNHGEVYLKSPSGEVLHCQYNTAFWDEDQKDSYEEYIFSVTSEELEACEIWGEFWTCNGGTIEGNWQVTFPLTKQ